jgi:hypothetical protein
LNDSVELTEIGGPKRSRGEIRRPTTEVTCPFSAIPPRFPSVYHIQEAHVLAASSGRSSLIRLARGRTAKLCLTIERGSPPMVWRQPHMQAVPITTGFNTGIKKLCLIRR